MIRLYDEQEPWLYEKKANKYIALSVLVAVLDIAFSVTLCLLTDRHYVLAFAIPVILVNLILGFLVLYWVFEKILASIAYGRLLLRLQEGEEEVLEGKFVFSGRTATLAKDIEMEIAHIEGKDGKRTQILYDPRKPHPADLSLVYRVTCRHGQVIAYEEEEAK